MNLRDLAGGTTLGQGLFTVGLIVFLASAPIIFFGCPRWIANRMCVDNEGNNYFNLVGFTILGVGLLMFVIGWLLMKEEHIEEPKP